MNVELAHAIPKQSVRTQLAHLPVRVTQDTLVMDSFAKVNNY